jgi:hypothetical protein
LHGCSQALRRWMLSRYDEMVYRREREREREEGEEGGLS